MPSVFINLDLIRLGHQGIAVREALTSMLNLSLLLLLSLFSDTPRIIRQTPIL